MSPRASRSLSCRRRADFVNRAEVVIIVLGDEETQVDDGHWLLKTRVQRGAREFLRVHARQSLQDGSSCGAEVGQNGRYWPVIVTRLVRLSVLEISRAECCRALIEIIKSLIPQWLEIK